ncbi:two-component system sensor histidine kinase CreC [Acinetobacter sp.]|uniref:two-component system sensor histidine kinase CreC n=1 Tax=Acinetobacter sp. TaxID=472 RepID=UPI0035AEF118
MSIFVRIWFFFSLILIVVLWFMLYTINQQIKPNVRQVVEDTLAENANIVAQLIAEDVHSGYVNTPEFNVKIQHALSRDLHAQIWQHSKNQIHQQIYITDAKGIVLYDSTGVGTGQDYSQWNDVYLTLRGRYGARSTRTNVDDEQSSTMYIAAPIIYDSQLIGVVSLGKPNFSVQPYISRAQKHFLEKAIWVAIISLLFASIVAWWLRRSIDRVRRYAQALAPVNEAPHFYSAKELNQVTQAVTEMREKLEDRAYVEHYVNTLTHELKSPLTAIQASAEILQDPLPFDHQQHFARNIEEQSKRLRDLIDRMLLLTRLEKSAKKFERERLNLSVLIENLIEAQGSRIQQKKIQLIQQIQPNCELNSDAFWLKQAVNNVLDNALDFTPNEGVVIVQLTEQEHHFQIVLFNQGTLIPDFAMTHIFEHYYSLPRPETQQRSSGIGLTIVQQVLDGSGGTIQIKNVESLQNHTNSPFEASVLSAITENNAHVKNLQGVLVEIQLKKS